MRRLSSSGECRSELSDNSACAYLFRLFALLNSERWGKMFADYESDPYDPSRSSELYDMLSHDVSACVLVYLSSTADSPLHRVSTTVPSSRASSQPKMQRLRNASTAYINSTR